MIFLRSYGQGSKAQGIAAARQQSTGGNPPERPFTRAFGAAEGSRASRQQGIAATGQQSTGGNPPERPFMCIRAQG